MLKQLNEYTCELVTFSSDVSAEYVEYANAYHTNKCVL